MGAYASAPIDLTRVQRSGGAFWRGAVAEMQGWRVSHEDAHFMSDGDWTVFGVLDGHCGSTVARLGADQLPAALREAAAAGTLAATLVATVQQSFISMDKWLRAHPDSKDAGSTVTTAGFHATFKDGKRSYVGFLANAGDSRGLVLRRGVGVIAATEDHKPDSAGERARIVAAGGFVSDHTAVPRLDGNISVSRGFGDFDYKSVDHAPEAQKLCCVPDVTGLSALSAAELRDGDVLVLACDGVFDVLDNGELGQLVLDGLASGADAGDLAADVIRGCLERDSKDNMTLMIVQVGTDGSGYAEVHRAMRWAAAPAMQDQHETFFDASAGNDLSTDEFKGLDHIYEQFDIKVQRAYVDFLEYCATSHGAAMGLPPDAAAVLRRARAESV
ncbi:phosphatase 2C-like domain-containing protein [Pelagophyceae sp. CCMP2097]|nr:phosphatase 2C-like domain-containing protein [Pelagophyceae sp. CCMP2097]|mmetsp:Transcript_32332/g.111796  ORF Transcript_32332/g.111796 Transcript_32332/m.111796 type:complete len:387 (-) Transcript_32332:118-1278(-)